MCLQHTHPPKGRKEISEKDQNICEPEPPIIDENASRKTEYASLVH